MSLRLFMGFKMHPLLSLSLVKALRFSIIKINLIFKRWVEESNRDERNILNKGEKSLSAKDSGA